MISYRKILSFGRFGAEEKFADVAANQLVEIEEGKGVVRTEQFTRRK